MKRKWVYLALPLLLVALIFGAKWQRDHPTQTKLDLKIRALLSKPSKLTFYYSALDLQGLHSKNQDFSTVDFKPFITSFYLAPQPNQLRPKGVSARDVISFDWEFENLSKNAPRSADIHIHLFTPRGSLTIYGPTTRTNYNLHPTMVKR